MTGEDDLVREYGGMVWRIASRYFLAGGEREDLVQEGLVGLTKAIRDYQPELGSFPTFAHLCIERQIITAVKTGDRAKHRPLTGALREALSDDGSVLPILELVIDPLTDTPTLAEQRAELARLAEAMRTLSPLERRSILGVANGLSYAQIGGNPKSIDNAVQRARLKLREAA